MSVSMRTAVWIVMCSEPVIRAPVSGCWPRYFSRSAMRPGHLVLGELDLLAAEGHGLRREVFHLVRQVGEQRQAGVHERGGRVGAGERGHGWIS